MTSPMMINISAVLGLINIVFVLIVLILPEWRVNAPASSQPNLQYIRYKEGLWLRCSGFQNEYFSCDRYDSSIIGLAGKYLACFISPMSILSSSET